MSRVLDGLNGKDTLPPHAVAITVDDGHCDFLSNAFPVFFEYAIPTTVYLVTDFIDGNFWLWWDRIRYAVHNSPLGHVELQIGGQDYQFSLQTLEERADCCEKLEEALKGFVTTERDAEIRHIVAALRAALPARPPEECKALSWSDVRYLAAHNVEFGGHTRTHPILSSIQDDSNLEDEINGCRRRLQQELDLPAVHFAYPNGRAQDINKKATAFVRASGFETAVTTQLGMNKPGQADLFLLRRIPILPSLGLHKFAELLAGVAEP